MKIYAHRGNKSEFPENSLLAFRSAIELGVDGIECDVHISADGEAVIIHDETIDRTSNGQGEIIEMTLNEIKAVKLMNPDNSLSDELIPTLNEMLDEFDIQFSVENMCLFESPGYDTGVVIIAWVDAEGNLDTYPIQWEAM